MTTHEQKVFRIALLGGAPAVGIALWFLATRDFAGRTQWSVGTLIVLAWLISALIVRENVVRPLQTLSNMIAALREQDYSLRARRAQADDALGLALWEINALTGEMHDRRLGALEAGALLRRVMAEIDVAVFLFDESGALRVVNAYGARLLGQTPERLMGRPAGELGLAACLEGAAPRIVDLPLGPRRNRWELRRGEFREGGLPHRFVVLADVSRTLREQERVAWQRLIRVLGHEINNSITPIKSLAERLLELVRRQSRGEPLVTPMPGSVRTPSPDASHQTPDALRDDLERGLGVITSRSEGLTRFLASYTQLARLPAPTLRETRVRDLVQRAARLEPRLKVEVDSGPDVTLNADPDQLEQLLINLVKNATDAALTTKGGVRVRWAANNGSVEVCVQDDGPGLAETANLFVPFFTTKPGGSGIGLVLCRQIAEAHGGTVTLANRAGATGCDARLVLPLSLGAHGKR